MDLQEHEHNKTWILYLPGATSRYSAASLIRTKNKGDIFKQIYIRTKDKGDIYKQIYRVWIAYFGSTYLSLCDNGGKFSYDFFQEKNEKLMQKPEWPLENHNLVMIL